jgi:hypothetical protein
MHIKCTNGSPILGTLDHLPPLPLFVDYVHARRGIIVLMERDELGICHALRFHDRVRRIHLDLPPSTVHKVLVLMDEHFPILEHFSLSLADNSNISLTLPKAFLAINLRHLAVPNLSPPRRLRFLTSTVSLVTLKLSNIETSSYFRPRVLVARLQSLPQLEELSIEFSIPIPRPSTERELLGGQRAPATVPSLKTVQFKGVGAYLEPFVAQIRAPRLERLEITLFNQIALALPHLSHLINITEIFKLLRATVHFGRNEVSINTAHHMSHSRQWFDSAPFVLRVMCKQLDWQIDCAAQICNSLIPTLCGVEKFMLSCDYWEIPTEFQNGAIGSTTWHDLLRPFIGMKELRIYPGLLEELSQLLQEDEVRLNPGFLPDLQHIAARDNLFPSFIDTRRGVGRPVEFSKRYD